MSDSTYYIDDVAVALNNIKINAAEAIQSVSKSGATIISATSKVVLVGVGLGTGIMIDVTLGDEPIDQAIVSQVAGQMLGGGALIGVITILTAASAAPAVIIVSAAAADAVAAYGADKAVDALYPMVRDNILGAARNLYQASEAQASPLILDLDGDGVETTRLGLSTYFDHDTNGFAEQTAWVGSDDGLLVLDRNGNGTIDNGTELFGNNTILATGQRAANGFAALRDLDSNADGKLDASDIAYSQLKVCKDANNNGITDQGELITLAEAGVASISTTYTNSATVDANGSAHKQIGSFTRTDGTTASVADVWFSMDAMYSIPHKLLAETDEIANLPDLQGSGVLHSLHQAMLRDTDGTIKQLVEVFAAADGYENGEIRSMG